MTSNTDLKIDANALRQQVREMYSDVALAPQSEFHFHTGRLLAKRLGYSQTLIDSLPDEAVESFAGVANPFSLRPLAAGEKVVDAGSGGGVDSFVAAKQVGSTGQVIGVDMTPEMVDKSTSTARSLGFDEIEFRESLLEDIPVEDGWADVIISNGVFNLCADKPKVFAELWRILRPGGRLQFADIANGKEVPEAAMHRIDLWCA
jgi:arsenite methyltransferase